MQQEIYSSIKIGHEGNGGCSIRPIEYFWKDEHRKSLIGWKITLTTDKLAT